MQFEYVVANDLDSIHPYGFDLRYKICWNNTMYSWCVEQFGEPYDRKVNPEGIWARYHAKDYGHFTQLRFQKPEYAVAFRFKFL